MRKNRLLVLLAAALIPFSLAACSTTGLQGSQGIQGETGPKGDKGEKGDAGNSVVSISKTKTEGNIDTYTIYYLDGSTSNFTVTNGINGEDGKDGINGEQGIQGQPGKDGHSPKITIGDDGYWYVDGVKTDSLARGPKGDKGDKGEKGDKGDAGINGTSSLSGNGVPDKTLGNEGDTYTDFDTFNVYKKENGVWVLKGNLKNGSGSTEEGKNYTVTLDPDGGELSTTKFTVSYGRAFTLPVPTKNAYSFLGWMDSNNNLLTNDKGVSIGVYPIAGDMTLKAKWNHTGYTLHYIIDGKEVKSENYDENKELTIDQSYNDPNFEGWYTDEIFSKKATSTSELIFKGNDKYVYGALSDLAYFSFYDDGNSYRVIKYTGTKENVVIPSTYNGKPVTAIHANAFKDNDNIRKVIIPDSVTSIGNGAFYSCSLLINVNIPNSVISIDNRAFFGCSSLVSVNIPNSVTSIGDFAFQSCSSLKSVNIPNGVVSIGSYAFDYCPSLTLYCEANSKPNGWDQFWNYHSDRPVVWNATGEHGEYEGFKYAVTKDGLITLTGYSGKKTDITLPSEINVKKVTSIADNAFNGLYSLISVNVPNSVKSIGAHAFNSCTSLVAIIISSSVTSIGGYAFSGCSSLTLYCEASSKPSGWNQDWNISDRPVVWGYKPNQK